MELNILKNITVLCIEDDNKVREELKSFLTKLCKRVLLAKDGKEGLELINQNKSIDIVITDISMPNLSGVELAKRVRNSNNEIPIIFITDEETTDILRESIKLKIESFILKPINKKELAISLLNISTALLNKQTVESQFEELKSLKKNIEGNSAVLKIDESLETIYANQIFYDVFNLDRLKTNVKDLFIYQKDEEAFLENLMDVYRDGSWCGDVFLKNNEGVNKAIYLEIVLEKNMFKDKIYYILIMKDLSDKYQKQRNIKKNLLQKNSEIYMTGRESKAEVEKELIGLQKEIKRLEQANNELMSNASDTALGELTKLREKKRELEAENRELNKFKRKSIDKITKIEEIEKELDYVKVRNEKLSESRAELKKKVTSLEDELKIWKEKRDVNASEIRIEYWRNLCKNLEKEKAKLTKELNTLQKDKDKKFTDKLFSKK